MANTELKRGSIVYLKSGSCAMTIREIKTEIPNGPSNPKILSDNIISVDWFWEGEIKKADFYESQIKK